MSPSDLPEPSTLSNEEYEAIYGPPEEGPNYRDFAPPSEDDPEAYDEMVWQERLEREMWGDR